MAVIVVSTVAIATYRYGLQYRSTGAKFFIVSHVGGLFSGMAFSILAKEVDIPEGSSLWLTVAMILLPVLIFMLTYVIGARKAEKMEKLGMVTFA